MFTSLQDRFRARSDREFEGEEVQEEDDDRADNVPGNWREALASKDKLKLFHTDQRTRMPPGMVKPHGFKS